MIRPIDAPDASAPALPQSIRPEQMMEPAAARAGHGKVSVIIPTYNRAPMVVEAVASVLAQGYPDMEVLVVDDGSNDDTWQRLEVFGERIIRIQQKNQGVAAARNTGLARATGDFIAFLDSDDLWHQRKLEIQVAYLAAHPEVGLVACHARPLHAAPQCVRTMPDAGDIVCTPITCASAVLRSRFATSTVLVRRSCLDAVGSFDTTLAVSEDRDLWVRIAARFAVRRQELDLTFTRLNHADHLSGKPGNERHTQQMIEKVFREIPELRGRWMLKRRALSVVAYEASIICSESGDHAGAIGNLRRSLVLWPISNRSARSPRLKVLVVTVLRLMGLRRS